MCTHEKATPLYTVDTNRTMCIAFTKAAPKQSDANGNISCPKRTRSSAGITNSAGSADSLPEMESTILCPPTPRNKVRFAQTEPKIVCNLTPSSEMTEEERSDIHWQLQDYDLFRGTARIIATEVLKLTVTQPPSAHSYDSVLTRAHQVCAAERMQEEKQDQSTISRTTKYADDDVCLPPNLFAALTHWTKAGHSRRGLEKFCVPHHMQNRPLERQAVVQAVLIAQDLLAETRRSGQKEGTFRLGAWEFSLSLPDDEILRMVSERFTKTSRRFGTAMGHADAAAVGNYTHDQKV